MLRGAVLWWAVLNSTVFHSSAEKGTQFFYFLFSSLYIENTINSVVIRLIDSGVYADRRSVTTASPTQPTERFTVGTTD